MLPALDAFPRAKQAALRALAIEPTLAEAHTSLGLVAFYHDWNWDSAERALRQGVAADPEYAYGHNVLGVFLGAMGRFDEALAATRHAESLEPLSTLHATNTGLVLYFAHRWDDAVRQFQRALELDRGYFTAQFWMGCALAQADHDAEARVALAEAHRLSGGQPIVVAAAGVVHAGETNRKAAREQLDLLTAAATQRHVPAYFVGIVHAALGEEDEAFRWLDRAFAERSGWMARLKVEPWMDGLRGDQRFSLRHRAQKIHVRESAV